MTAVLSAPPTVAPVRVVAADERMRTLLSAALRLAGIPLASIPGGAAVPAAVPAVVASAAETVEEAVAACGPDVPAVVVADRFSQIGVRRAMRLGTKALLRFTDLDPARLLAAVDAARSGDGRVPHEVLARLLAGDQSEPGRTPLTRRQTSVLALMADGHGNADIARLLGCSEHTVKNTIYELMGRLQARNRSHAVARAILTGLI